MDVALAVPLFERGFNEDQIKEALGHCSTFEEALDFLTRTHVDQACGDMAPPQKGGEKPRRRCRKGVKTSVAALAAPAPSVVIKKEVEQPAVDVATEDQSCEQDYSLPSLTVSLAARLQAKAAQPNSSSSVCSAPTPSETESTAAGDSSTISASTPVDSEVGLAMPSASFEVRVVEEITPPPVRRIRPIEYKEEGMKWWREAAARWPKIVQNLKLEAARNILRPECPEEVQEYLGRPTLRLALPLDGPSLSTPSRKRSLDFDLQEFTASENSIRNKYARQDSASAVGQVPTPSRSSAGEGSCRSPAAGHACSSSPQSMRLNSAADMCKICCCDTQPWRSVQLSCGHGWYCASCMLRHAEARLDNGAASVTCPECSTVLAERELRKLLPTETIERLLARSLEQAVSLAADLWACPTPNCPMRVALDDDEIGRLQCTLCKKSSCLRCGRQPFHRGLTCEEYAEKLKGKSKKQKEEDSLRQWMEETGSKQCPTCRMGVTKQNIDKQNTQYSECHKMCCRNCGTKFCFKCLAVLSDCFTCGCTIDAHGFIDPVTGKRVNHLDRRKKQQKGRS